MRYHVPAHLVTLVNNVQRSLELARRLPCRAPGPRGQVCTERLWTHGPRHRGGPTNQPRKDCDVCEAKGSERCEDPKVCAGTRRRRAEAALNVIFSMARANTPYAHGGAS